MPQYIHINGYSGVGKLTIAKKIEKLIPNSKIYHNQLFIDTLASLVDRHSPHYHDIRSSFRRHILNISYHLKQYIESVLKSNKFTFLD